MEKCTAHDLLIDTVQGLRENQNGQLHVDRTGVGGNGNTYEVGFSFSYQRR